jgi:hypothetical protein
MVAVQTKNTHLTSPQQNKKETHHRYERFVCTILTYQIATRQKLTIYAYIFCCILLSSLFKQTSTFGVIVSVCLLLLITLINFETIYIFN